MGVMGDEAIRAPLSRQIFFADQNSARRIFEHSRTRSRVLAGDPPEPGSGAFPHAKAGVRARLHRDGRIRPWHAIAAAATTLSESTPAAMAVGLMGMHTDSSASS